MANKFKFDYKAFEVALSKAIHNVFQLAQNEFGENSVYAFYLESDAEFGRLTPIVCTEPLLDRIVTENLKYSPELYIGMNHDNVRSYHRHDWLEFKYREDEFTKQLYVLFKTVNSIILGGGASLDGMMRSAFDEHGNLEKALKLGKFYELKYRQALFKVLSDLDKKGFWGKSEQREKVTIIVYFTGLFDDEQFQEMLLQLNSKQNVERFTREVKVGLESGVSYKVNINNRFKQEQEDLLNEYKKYWDSE